MFSTDELITAYFDGSKFVAEKLTIPADIARARFGSAFKLEGDRLVAYDSAGVQIFSRSRPGENATFDEALESLVDAHPQRDSIRAAASDDAAPPPTMTRSVFDRLPALAQGAHVRAGGKVVD
jgi:hypothetical protein